MSNIPQVPFDPDGSQIKIHIFVGQAHWAKYWIDLHDEHGKNGKRVDKGVTHDTIPDVAKLTDLSNLNHNIVHWIIRLSTFEANPQEDYHLEVTVTQGENELHNVTMSNPLTSTTKEVEGIFQLVHK